MGHKKLLQQLEAMLATPEHKGSRRFIALALCEHDRLIAFGCNESADILIQEAGARLDLCAAPVLSVERCDVFQRMAKYATWRKMPRKNVA